MNVKTIQGVLESNTFVVEAEDTVIIIDAGAPLNFVLKILGTKVPHAILITHSHFDHTQYLKEYINAFNCPVYAPKDEKEFAIGALQVKPLLCPGHSPDSVVYLIEDYLFTGDVLFKDTIGRTDFMKNGDALMQKSLRKLLNIKFTAAYHGHGDASTFNEQQENIKYFLN